MVNEVRIYVEGGGDHTESKRLFRTGFDEFLRDLNAIARQRRIRWSIIAYGSREATHENYQDALADHPDTLIILLVDSEGPVRDGQEPYAYLREHDRWMLEAAENPCCHLMVQMMEAWLIADIDALREFYGPEFHERLLPRHTDVEQISKDMLSSALDNATRHTKRGKYHKIKHAPKLLEKIEVQKVRKSAKHCNRLFTFLTEQMDG